MQIAWCNIKQKIAWSNIKQSVFSSESDIDYDIFQKLISNFDNLDYEVKILFVTFATSPSPIGTTNDNVIEIIDPFFTDDEVDLTSE